MDLYFVTIKKHFSRHMAGCFQSLSAFHNIRVINESVNIEFSGLEQVYKGSKPVQHSSTAHISTLRYMGLCLLKHDSQTILSDILFIS